ncbi:MAG: UvrD-helicase domain-containing protein [Chloroflexota bacterium]|nr:UvrD-helicase domain-containing protein [Chloroflexota bacterium]
MADLLNELNQQQQQAVTAPPGPVLVLAGPGSGKTRVLTFRIAYLIAALGVPAYQILAVTFTNKAAREMENRVSGLLGGKADGLWLGTFHSICGRILRREAAYLPIDHNYVIFDTDDQRSLVKRVIKEMGINEKDYRPRTVLGKISMAKNDLIGPDEYPILTFRDDTIKSIYQGYQEYLIASNAMDFDDMLLYTANLLEEHPEVRRKYSQRFRHILVDEFQDTNQAQYVLLHRLASYHENIFVVGDEDQSIYRWRGADYRNVERFTRDFPNAKKILLEQNYRSTQTILDAAVAVIDENPNRTRKSLFSDRGTGKSIIIYEGADDHDEAAYVVDTISRQVMLGKARESDFAIMYRTNAQSRLLEEAFRRANMSYRLVGAQRFYGRREVRDAIAFLRLVYNPKDEVSLARVINLPARGIGAVTLEQLQAQARKSGLSSGEVLLTLGTDAGSEHDEALGRAAARLLPFAHLLQNWREHLNQVSLTALFDQILLDTDYEPYIKDDDDEEQERWANVMELRQVLLEYEDRGLAEFLEAMALVADQDTLPETLDAPTLMTLHAAKGLEFPQVFIIGLDEHYLPHSRSRDEPEAMAEERRLFYVGLTRAKNQLYLLRARRRRSPYGSYESMQPSRFLEDVPENLTSGRITRSYEQRESYDVSAYQWDKTYGKSRSRERRETPKTAIQRFQPEMHVKHPVYGEGVVRNSRLEFGDETVEVYFDGLGLKALVASMSSLEILE